MSADRSLCKVSLKLPLLYLWSQSTQFKCVELRLTSRHRRCLDGKRRGRLFFFKCGRNRRAIAYEVRHIESCSSNCKVDVFMVCYKRNSKWPMKEGCCNDREATQQSVGRKTRVIQWHVKEFVFRRLSEYVEIKTRYTVKLNTTHQDLNMLSYMHALWDFEWDEALMVR